MFLRDKEDRRSASLLSPEKSLLLIIDCQEKFSGAVAGMDEVGRRVAILVKAAARLGVPMLVSEQYPKALGSTLPEIKAGLSGSAPVYSKMSFSAFDVPEWAEAVRSFKRSQFILCGVESHVCVLQTAMDALQNLDGLVYVVEDAVSSRQLSDKETALRRLESQGVQRVTTEMILFEWLRMAGTPEFK